MSSVCFIIWLSAIHSAVLADGGGKVVDFDGTSGNEYRLAGEVKRWTHGRGLDVAITACPVPSVQAAMPPLMNYGGRVNFFGGIPASKQPVALDTNQIHYHELYITGSTRSSIAQFRKTLDFVSQGLVVAFRYVVYHRIRAWYKEQRALRQLQTEIATARVVDPFH